MDRTDSQSKEHAPVAGLTQRAFTRLPFEHAVRWLIEPSDAGLCMTHNFGRGGMCISLGRYLRPGRELRVFFDDIQFESSPVCLEVRIAWCHPTAKDAQTYVAGLQVLHAQPEALSQVSEVFYTAVDCLRIAKNLHSPAKPCPYDRPSLAS